MKYDRDALIVMLNVREQADRARAARRMVEWEKEYRAWKRSGGVAAFRAAIEAHNPDDRRGFESHSYNRTFDPPEKPRETGACSDVIRERNRIAMLPVDKRGCVNIAPKDAALRLVPCTEDLTSELG